MTIGLDRNNPWNLLAEHIPWMGLLESQPASGPLVFDTLEDGIRAGVKLCYTYQGREWNTPEIFIPRFSPAKVGNPTAQYLQNVCAWTGFGEKEVLDFHNTAILCPWARAIWRQEQGSAASFITDTQIFNAKALADES